AVSGEPFIFHTANTFPTRSTTAMTAGLACACASATARAIAVWTSPSERKLCAFAQEPVQPESGVPVGGGEVPMGLPELLPPPQAPSTAQTNSMSETLCAIRIAISPAPSE